MLSLLIPILSRSLLPHLLPGITWQTNDFTQILVKRPVFMETELRQQITLPSSLPSRKDRAPSKPSRTRARVCLFCTTLTFPSLKLHTLVTLNCSWSPAPPTAAMSPVTPSPHVVWLLPSAGNALPPSLVPRPSAQRRYFILEGFLSDYGSQSSGSLPHPKVSVL